MSGERAKRIVVFGATGQLGQQLIARIAEGDWPIAELLGVVSDESAGSEFEFRGELLDVVTEWPVLKERDLVFICTPAAEALEVVREALRAEVPCIDCSGALAVQLDVPMPLPLSVLPTSTSTTPGAATEEDRIAKAPLLAVPSGTTLAWLPILEAIGVSRVIGTVLCSASSQGRRGVVALSEESIALFNQHDGPTAGPAGQAVAFDVIPSGGIDCQRVGSECQRLIGEDLKIGVSSVQVPTFVGEGASLALELKEPLDAGAIEARLAAMDGLRIAHDGFGSRGLEAIEAGSTQPSGPTLRDAADSNEILVGRIEPDPSLPENSGWRIWIASNPLRLVADEALRLAGRRLGLV